MLQMFVICVHLDVYVIISARSSALRDVFNVVGDVLNSTHIMIYTYIYIYRFPPLQDTRF